MKALDRLTSRTLVLDQDNIDTDQIIPARFLTMTDRSGLADACFADWRFDDDGKPTDNVLNQPQARTCEILITGQNFGCGSSREHAPWALLDFGFRVVISNELADIFRNNSLNNGLLPVIVDETDHRWLLDHPGSEVTVDLPNNYIEFAAGRRASFEIPAFPRYCMLNGIDPLGYLLEQQAAITRFEQQGHAA